MDPTGTFKLVPPVDSPFPLLLELFSAAPVTFPGNNLLLCFGEAQPLFLHSVLLMRAQGTRRESSRKWEGASGAWLKLPRSFDVPWWGRGLLSPPIPLANPAWHQLTLAKVATAPAAKGFWQKGWQSRGGTMLLTAK